MAKRKDDNSWWVLIGLAVGAVALYYTAVGREEENAAFIPDSLEDRVDMVVKALNEQFGREWVDRGLDALKYALQRTLPSQLVMLVGAISTAELMSRITPMSGRQKQQVAVDLISRNR